VERTQGDEQDVCNVLSVAFFRVRRVFEDAPIRLRGASFEDSKHPTRGVLQLSWGNQISNQGALMSLREVLAGAIARDPRYSIDAYEFVFAALDLAKVRKRKARRARSRGRKPRAKSESRHVSGRELSEAARDLALDLYGRLALTILSSWGLRSTSDLGEIVYILIASGDLERSDEDQRSDFDDVYDFEAALCHDYVIPIEEPEEES
jgi:uncharacterized repeat protein (TIGR04138 family)